MIDFKRHKTSISVLLFLIVARFIAMIWIPLNDSTEARYAEIARIMQETGNWVTPMHHYGEPFWAKPPLSTWLSALSMQCFGVAAWSARLPALLLSIVMVWMVAALAKKYRGHAHAWTTRLVLSGCFYFFLDAGAVMTDPALLFCTTLSLIAFWRAVVMEEKIWGYWFFIGLGLGLLAKGPLAGLLVGMPLFVWILWHGYWQACWRRLPIVVGLLLMLAIALPWYILAEHATPGFLNYFIVGEHIQRFLTPGWTGDLYGFAHQAPLGMIWLYAFLGFMPWSLVMVVWWFGFDKQTPTNEHDLWRRYLVLCGIMPLVFFTFARNIIYPYVFPCLPFMALWFSEFVARLKGNQHQELKLALLASVSGVIFLLATALFVFYPDVASKSQDRVVALFLKQHPNPKDDLLYWAPQVEYSAQFYAKGHVRATLDESVLRTWLKDGKRHYLVTSSIDYVPFPESLKAWLHPVGTVHYRYGDFTLNAIMLLH